MITRDLHIELQLLMPLINRDLKEIVSHGKYAVSQKSKNEKI